jgi:nicotinate-nucleotide adenylyltransferase
MGGTFDPVHVGHVDVALRAREALDLDLVELVPCHLPPHKGREDLTGAAHRLRMAELACKDSVGLEASAREIERGGVSYTVVTLRELRSEAPADEVFFLMGADSLAELDTWLEPGEIVRLARVVVLNRPGHPLRVPDALEAPVVAAAEGTGAPGEIWTLEMPPADVSSTEIRRLAATGGSLAGLVPAAVAQYIEESGLYRERSR